MMEEDLADPTSSWACPTHVSPPPNLWKTLLVPLPGPTSLGTKFTSAGGPGMGSSVGKQAWAISSSHKDALWHVCNILGWQSSGRKFGLCSQCTANKAMKAKTHKGSVRG